MKKTLTLLCASFISYASQAQNPQTSIANWKNNAAGTYSFIHDDYGDPSVIGINNYADTIARNRGIKFTFGAITSSCENNPSMWTQAIDMINYGHEIINHSHNHTCAVFRDGWCETGLWAEPGTQDFATEMTLSTNLIDSRTGTYPRYFIYPYDLFNAAANNHLKTLDYIGSRTGDYEGTDGINFTPDASGFFTSSLIVDAQTVGNETVAINLNYWADYAATNNVWVNREMHNVGNTGWGRISVSDYRNHLNHLKTKMDANELWVGTVSEVLTYQIQKLNYTPSTAYNGATGEITITWNTPSFDVPGYLAPLSKKSPVTLLVDLDGIDPTGLIVTQGIHTISGVTLDGGKLKFDAYPHEGTIKISSQGCSDFCFVSGLSDQTKNVGFNLTYSINITSTLPVSYTWYLNDVIIPNQNSNQLVLTNLQLNQAGTYKVVATNGSETMESSGVLTITNQQPYNNVLSTIPGVVQFENFDVGGQGISYNESSGTNEGDANIRTEPVDIENTTGGGYNIGYTTAGEWLEYSVNIQTSGIYTLKIRHASLNVTGDISISVDGKPLNTYTLPATGGWQTWTISSFSGDTLLAGTHELRVSILDQDINLDQVEFSLDQIITVIKSKESEVLLFPNPFTNNFTIKSDQAISSVRIFDLNGQLLEQSSSANTLSVQLGETLIPGVYVVEITSNGLAQREKLVKQ